MKISNLSILETVEGMEATGGCQFSEDVMDEHEPSNHRNNFNVLAMRNLRILHRIINTANLTNLALNVVFLYAAPGSENYLNQIANIDSWN
ncbi:hypothetical protein [Nodularia chucula]|uniref:hypothetical protein n=1 Tax=Nodularia chucula TaxID=3093667 RepID=UPI0039C6B3B2